jgi:tRNA modification GTPase
MKDTIAAISTPQGYGGIGIVRLSGEESLTIASRIFKQNKRTTGIDENRLIEKDTLQLTPRKLHHGFAADPEKDGIVDEVLAVFMPSPHSYTGEDVVEIQAHAGTVVIKEILELILKQGARLAQPGEFTRRAYLNGRMDLSQAEAVMDIIQAKTDLSLNIAANNLEGALGETARSIKDKLLEINAVVEAQIEFPDDIESETEEAAEIIEKCSEVSRSLAEMVDAYKNGTAIRDGLRLVIIGRANVGKSSLLNRFLRRDRAIVTEFPGTTRDSIEEVLNIKGLPVIMVDTAGLRDSDDPVERIGMERTRRLSEKADLILFMVDAGKGVLPEDKKIYREIESKEKILVINKTDLLKPKEGMVYPEEWEFMDVCETSLKLNSGVDSLKDTIFKFGTHDFQINGGSIVPNLRQGVLFENAYHAVGMAEKSLKGGISMDMAAIDLKEAMDAMDEITGESVKTDVMDAVFSRFCIGK